MQLGTYKQLMERGVDFNKLVKKSEEDAMNAAEEADAAAAAAAVVAASAAAALAADVIKRISASGTPTTAAAAAPKEAMPGDGKAVEAGKEEAEGEDESAALVPRTRSYTSTDVRDRLRKTLSMKEKDGKITKVGGAPEGVYTPTGRSVHVGSQKLYTRTGR